MKNWKMLKKNYEFRLVLKKGKYYSGKYIECFAFQNYEKQNKIGIAIKTKYGKAVKRNRLKRLIKESFRKNEEKLKKGNSIVFLAKKNCNNEIISFQKVEEDIIFLLEKIGQDKEK